MKNIVDKKDRYVEIYVLKSKTSGKYRRYGAEKRFLCHVSEAFSKKRNQCHYLNNAIRKYGKDDFIIDIIEKTSLGKSDDIESKHIISFNTMFPNGYNLKLGTRTTRLSEEGRKRVSKGVQNYYYDKKLSRFTNVVVEEDKIDTYIRPLKRKTVQYGYYVYIQQKKADFGGTHISLDESYTAAKDFLFELIRIQRQRDILLREVPKDSVTTIAEKLDDENTVNCRPQQ